MQYPTLNNTCKQLADWHLLLSHAQQANCLNIAAGSVFMAVVCLCSGGITLTVEPVGQLRTFEFRYILTSAAFCSFDPSSFSHNFTSTATVGFTAETKTIILVTPPALLSINTYTATLQVVSCRWGCCRPATGDITHEASNAEMLVPPA
jgi:hypothetical protein